MSWEAWGTPSYLDDPICETCDGQGELVNDFGHLVKCPDCLGTGLEDIPGGFDDDAI